MFVYFVINTRQLKLPRALHTWGWMTALLLVSIVSAWWLGAWFGGFGLFAELAARFPQVKLRPEDIAVMDSLGDTMVLGIVVGIVGAFEALIIAVSSWIGDRFREDRVPPVVDLLPRLVIGVLQAPIFLVLVGGGLAAIGGATLLVTHAKADVSAALPWVAGSGLAAWALATFHLQRLYALAAGGWINRLWVAGVGIVATVAAALGESTIRGYVALAVWLVAQLIALRFTRRQR